MLNYLLISGVLKKRNNSEDNDNDNDITPDDYRDQYYLVLYDLSLSSYSKNHSSELWRKPLAKNTEVSGLSLAPSPSVFNESTNQWERPKSGGIHKGLHQGNIWQTVAIASTCGEQKNHQNETANDESANTNSIYKSHKTKINELLSKSKYKTKVSSTITFIEFRKEQQQQQQQKSSKFFKEKVVPKVEALGGITLAGACLKIEYLEEIKSNINQNYKNYNNNNNNNDDIDEEEEEANVENQGKQNEEEEDEDMNKQCYRGIAVVIENEVIIIGW
eukprot:CAMPEP_0114355858 /NCGR_PEP_ID=MMETSP0101-20121206/20541_1 /TAXON_ID=38822 ORGANISM="Pteridomonas danica, Strain PT" /NCGR_SAMPLE_ID=MMETSP0101 /ASSEMBLY_ACC=CAM_ASM_000211 /LENGTH=274 /DNA_ID=CAMNT_0001498029 /DNA_START=533 /DNA_END=1354 /DNA_ORIENTATION=-